MTSAEIRAVFMKVTPQSETFDSDVIDYIVDVILEEAESSKGHPQRLIAAIVDSIGPFLQDGGMAETDADVIRICTELMCTICPASFPPARRSETLGAEASLQAGNCTAPASGVVSSEADRHELSATAGSFTPACNDAQQPVGSGAGTLSGSTVSSSHPRVPRPRSKQVVEGVLRDTLSSYGVLSDLDEDIVEYMVCTVCEDPDEEEVQFADCIGPFLMDTNVASSEEEVIRLCQMIGRNLDAAASQSGAAEDDVENDKGFRKLTHAVKMGAGAELDAQANRLENLHMMGGWTAEKEKQEVQMSERMQQLAARNQEQAEAKRTAKEKKENEKTRKAIARSEAVNAELMSVEAAPMRRGPGEGAVDINIPQFSLPNPTGGKDLLEGAQLRLFRGHRYGLCGRNGAGKSTLLRLVAARKIVGLPPNLRILYVAQDTADKISRGDSTALNAVVESDELRKHLMAQKDALEGKDVAEGKDTLEEHAQQLVQIYEQLDAIGAAGAHERARVVLKGLQFSPQMMDTPVASLSGGWRMRVALAQALFQEPDVLLLDEPTNHLDLEAVMWLEERLSQDWGERTLVVVSHDRTFLNEVCTDMIHLWSNKLAYYAGDFDTFEAVRTEKRLHQQRMFEQQEAKRKELQKYVDKHLHKGSTLVKDDAGAKQAKKVAKQIDRMGTLGTEGKKYKLSYDGPQQKAEAVEEDSAFHFAFPDPGKVHSSTSMIQVNDVHFHYPSARKGVGGPAEVLFSGVDMRIDTSTRMALVGANGAGKSTLLKLILGELTPTKGEVVQSRHFKCAAFSQHHMDQLDLSMSPLEYLYHIARVKEPTITPEEVRAKIGKFSITGNFQTQRMELLSGGQKSRVAFCKATWDSPHLLMLDEPTNHLDVEAVDALIEAINDFKGGVIMVSHDQHFLQSTNADIWVVNKEQAPGMARFEGGFKQYKKSVLNRFSKRK
eukprot:CAMPEP_0198199308 /NCGR_PEP_ID=MMETSP1445-20131203/2625_1 /TAXON_ID=36898 /ORGANISM="Pyramimonas sp., Strain CCMP2087" /LENGTH=946 /DNA_ID=CAMNT_0043869121 /DNA_START=160 /DNA_END=3000 /DNA_ORIENTATION=-